MNLYQLGQRALRAVARRASPATNTPAPLAPLSERQAREAHNRFLAQKREIEAIRRTFDWLPDPGTLTEANIDAAKGLYERLIPTRYAPAREAQERNALISFMATATEPAEKERIHRLIAQSDVASGLITSSHVRKFPDIWESVQTEVGEFESAYGGPIFTTKWPSYSRGAALVRRFEIDRDKLAGKTVLHISPEAELRAWFGAQSKAMGVTYHTLNLGGDVDFVEDMTALAMEDQQYDWVICHRVLEHVFDDAAAITEIRRVLKPGGVFNVSVPESMHVPDDLFWAIPDHSHHYHYRQYGGQFTQKLRSCGLNPLLVEHALQVEASDGTFPFRMYDATLDK